MTTVTRGIVTVQGQELTRAGTQSEPLPPVTTPPAAGQPAPERSPLIGTARFVTIGPITGLSIPVEPHDRVDTPAEGKLVRAAKAELNGEYFLRFQKGRLDTDKPAVIAWLRDRIERGRLTGIREELAMRDVACPACGALVKAGALGAHVLAHEAIDAAAERGERRDA